MGQVVQFPSIPTRYPIGTLCQSYSLLLISSVRQSQHLEYSFGVHLNN